MSDHDEFVAPPPPITPRSSLGSGALSYSSGSSVSPSTTSSSGSQGSAKSAVSECLGAWLNYLNLLNNLCASGYRLAQTVASLEQWSTNEQGHSASAATTSTANSANALPQPTNPVNFQFVSAWDDLARATAVATSTVKSHVVITLQDYITQSLNTFDSEMEMQRVRDHNQQIVCENTRTMLNLQHQFCLASFNAFSVIPCCVACQTPVGFPHELECPTGQGQVAATGRIIQSIEVRSQTPSPHFGVPPHYRMPADARANAVFGSGSTQASSEHGTALEQTRGPSPQHRGPSPIQGFPDGVRGPFPNPGHLLAMKSPFFRGSRSPLNFPLFPLNGQRRWSEAAAGEVAGGEQMALDAESQMRRWSMPWEASKSDRGTGAWHNTRSMPISKLAIPTSGTGSDRSQSTTPDSMWQSSVTSQDGLAEAIQLLSCRPNRVLPPHIGPPPFIEEPPHTSNVAGVYGIWSNKPQQERLTFIKYPKGTEKSLDENPP